MHTDIQEITVDGLQAEIAQGRLEFVSGLIDQRLTVVDEASAGADEITQRLARFVGPAFPVHCHDVPELLEDQVCAAYLIRIARHAARAGVVVFLHGSVDEVMPAVTEASGALAAALVVGTSVRLGRYSNDKPDEATRAAEQFLRESFLGSLAHDPELFVRLMRDINLSDDARRRMASAMRRAAAVLDPAGAAAPAPAIPCPLCMASPMFPVSELPGHLIAKHASLAIGGAQ